MRQVEQNFEAQTSALNLEGRRLLDRYLVQDRLARGGMGFVFRGDDERLHRPVCVKVFIPLDPSRPEYATVLEHFVQEAFTLSRLSHPNTLRIYDFGYLDNQALLGPFFVTEFADGGTLAQLVEERGELAPAEVLRILEPIVGALAEAHDAGVVHRDIKPSNVLFTLTGSGLLPKLCDFSIAKTTGDFPNRAQDTNTQVPLFSASWAAPEQLLGGAVVGPSADVFALALTTVFMLTGFFLYPDEGLMRTYALRAAGDEFRRMRLKEFVKGSSVRRVLARACAEQPFDRYPSVEAYLEALHNALHADGGNLELSDSDLSVVSAIPEPLAQNAAPPKNEHGERTEDPQTRDDDTEDLATGIHRLRGTLPQQDRQYRSQDRALYVVSSDTPPNAPHPSAESGPVAAPGPVRPHFALASFSEEFVAMGSRRARLLEASEAALSFTAIDGGEHPRIRVTAMDVDGPRLHIKGLNCFVRVHGGRASSGLDLTTSASIELLSVRQSVSAVLCVSVGRRQENSIVCDLPEFSVVVPASVASWVVTLDSPSSPEAILLYRRPNA